MLYQIYQCFMNLGSSKFFPETQNKTLSNRIYSCTDQGREEQKTLDLHCLTEVEDRVISCHLNRLMKNIMIHCRHVR